MRVSVKHRRIWMIKLAIAEALRRNALSGASFRRLVGHLSYVFWLRRPRLFSHSLMRVCLLMTRTLAGSLSCGSGVRRELRWSAASLVLQCLQIYEALGTTDFLLAMPPCLAVGFVNADAQNTRLRKSGRPSSS